MRQLAGTLWFTCFVVTEQRVPTYRRADAAPRACRMRISNANQLYSLRTFANSHALE